jgi:ribosomal protein S18 acetylase RimI-like enzyme
MEILIRPWRTEDLPAVRRILWESWMAAYSAFIPEEDLRSYHEATYRIDSLAHLYKSTFVHGFIGEVDGAAAGFARTQFHLNENRLYLASLYLLPAFQGRGIGGGLLRAAEERARDYGIEELWVGVMVWNEAARRWYDKRGFRFVREEPFQMGRTTVPHRIGYKVIGESDLSGQVSGGFVPP